MKRRVLITGAAGNIGGKLAIHLNEIDRYDLRLTDQRAAANVTVGDLSSYGGEWPALFEGVDTVIHLAGEIRGIASWAEVHRANIVGVQNVLRAARENGVRRVVFASTNQVMLGYRFRDDVSVVTTDLPPAPLSPYGISKYFGEEMGRGFARETGASFIALRIGYFQRGENIPGPHMGIGTWGQQMWLSNRDMLQAMECAIEAADVPFAVVNLVSDNPGMKWDLEHTRRTIGYQPKDGHVAVITDELRAEDEHARGLEVRPGTWLNEYFDPVTP